MTKVLVFLHLDQPASLKRMVVLIASGALVMLSPLLTRFGLPVPSDTMLEVFAAIVTGWMLQSGANSIAAATADGKVAAASVDSAVKADAVILAAAKP